MSPVAWIALLWALFAATHLLLTHGRLRARLVGRLGASLFQALFSALALAIFVPLVVTYLRWKHAAPTLWAPERTGLLLWVVYVGMGLAFTLLIAGILRPSPASLAASARSGTQVRGALRITRHPVLMAFALFGLFHLLPNGRLTDVVFFGGFVVFVPLGCWHQDRRKLASADEAFARFHAQTPFWPFVGAGAWRGLLELSPLALVVGIGLTVLVRHFHAAWFG